MASPVFRKKSRTRTTSSKRKSYRPTPHQCQGSWQASKEVFGTSSITYCVFWDELDGWCLVQLNTVGVGRGRYNKNVTYKNATFRRLTHCPFCGEALKVVNEVSIE